MIDVLPTLAFALFVGVFLVAIFLILGGASNRMQRLNLIVSPRFIRDKVPSLLPWEPWRGLVDLSSLCRGTAESSALGGGMYHSRGTMQSRDHRGAAWLAYTVNTQRRNGTVSLHTSANELVVEIYGPSAAERRALIRVDGRSLGIVRLASSEILDPAGRPLGRVTGGKLITTYGMTNYRDVELNGQRLGEINSNLLHPGQRLGPPPPAFRRLAPDLSPDEELWLLALLALELYSDRNRLSL